MGYIKERQAKKLIEEAEKAKKEGESLSSVFSRVAADTGRAKGSVRNMYYRSLKRAVKDDGYAERVGGKDVKVGKIIEFDKAEARLIVKKILTGVSYGKSVRSVVSEMSDDPKTALRYMNKYRNMLKRDRKEVESVAEEVKRATGKRCDPYAKRRSDVAIERLKAEINSLYDRICERTKRENNELKSVIKRLSEENAALKARVTEK